MSVGPSSRVTECCEPLPRRILANVALAPTMLASGYRRCLAERYP
jgi:hypothetical protein